MKEEGGDCDTCEYRNEKSGEHCNSMTKCWQEAGWIKDKEIARLRTLIAELAEALRVADKYLLRDGDREIVQSAIAKAEKQIV